MPASIPTVDRRSIPAVAIIGNDAVLMASPATPVQLSHACLRRGFSVAVPASWGDELIAAQAMRKLALRDKGPAVMCVCPYARSRLLTPGPDLEPFLVSLVPPPVAAARYLRSVFGERGVHLTYIGSCPSASDPVIDERLTPDAFLADLAERGIALSEQPLVFDSIVPPDRRRWCSLPGGVPTAEMPGGDTDARTLIEIDRGDVSSDLAQHIIAREHVLLDVAPSLGCACSGAIGALTPRGRAAVTAMEPPRARGPVVDLTVVVVLDAPLTAAPVVAPVVGSAPVGGGTNTDLLERRLDEMLGAEASHPQIERALEEEFEAELDADLAEVLAAAHPAETPHRSERAPSDPAVRTDPAEPPDYAESAQPAIGTVASAVDSNGVSDTTVEVRDVHRDDHEDRRHVAERQAERPTHHVRRRTPPAMPSRHAGNSVPKATGTDGRPLPRAYVAKRRTPSMGIPSIVESPRDEPPRSMPDIVTHSPDEAVVTASSAADDVAAQPAAENTFVTEAPASVPESSPIVGAGDAETATNEQADSSRMGEPPLAETGERSPGSGPQAEPYADPRVSSGSSGAAAGAIPIQSAFRMLMFAVLLGFAVVVLYTLRS